MKIVIDLKLDNLNDLIANNRSNRYKGANKKKKEMEAIKWFLLKVPKIEKYPIKINCTWHVTNLGSDIDNLIIKSVLDQMQKMGILENDNIKHINELNHKAVKDKRDYLEIEIKENY